MWLGEMKMMDKPFAKFPVYQQALIAAKKVNLMCKRINSREFCFLKDQLRRAASSIVLNIAEGSGKWTKKDKINFYRIARASAHECSGALDLIIVYQLANEDNIKLYKREFERIAGDLQAMIFSIERRKI